MTAPPCSTDPASARACAPFQIHMSNSPRFRASSRSRMGVIHRPLHCRRGACAFLSLFPHMREGSGAPKGATSRQAPCGAACRVTGTHTSRRSTVAIFHAITVLLRRTGGLHRSVPGSIGAALHPIVSSHQRRAPHRGRTMTAPPGPWLRATAASATPCSANQASLDDALD
jgi:hypothetical protein